QRIKRRSFSFPHFPSPCSIPTGGVPAPGEYELCFADGVNGQDLHFTRIALALKGIEYETRPIHLIKDGGEQVSDSDRKSEPPAICFLKTHFRSNTEEFHKVNPMRQVPALLLEDEILTQSISIMEYLEETNPENPLLPKDGDESRFQTDKESTPCASGTVPSRLSRRLTNVDLRAQEMLFAIDYDCGFVSALEKLLARSAGKYCVGDNVTMADCCLVPQVFKAHR
ncbi:unnamed protein product, partial [Darwinula stevensoni]